MARVHYAQSWEDPLLLWEIWQRTCPDHVHMVASGGDHALELLQKGLPSVALCDPESNQLGHVEAKLRAPVITRKVLHVASAMVACILPFWLPPAEIVGMAALFAGLLALSKTFKILSSIHDVPRKTWGEVVFPLGIALVTSYVYGLHATPAGEPLWGPFHYTGDEGYFFGMLVLGILDVGAEWGGRIPSPKWPGMQGKSLAGSATFFLLGMGLGWFFGLPLSLTFFVGLGLLAILEAYLAYGLDNLFLPLGGALLYYATTGIPWG